MAPKQENAADQQAVLISLPISVVSRVDATHLAREVETVGNFLEQQKHHKGRTQIAIPSLSRMLGDITQVNKLDLAKSADRERLYNFLIELKSEVPTIHMSFAVEPPTLFVAKLITWLRSEVHPLLLLDIGLQPSIAAGCIIRTTNKYFDCSMRQHLVSNKPKLLELLRSKTHA
ncbi:MAG: hypothetical protein ABIQ89_01080 [Candidatus Saccharimonadales bacterium]